MQQEIGALLGREARSQNSYQPETGKEAVPSIQLRACGVRYDS